MFLGEAKLLTLGFRKQGSQRYVYEKVMWNAVRRKMSRKIIASIVLDRQGRVVTFSGIPKGADGSPMLFQNSQRW